MSRASLSHGAGVCLSEPGLGGQRTLPYKAPPHSVDITRLTFQKRLTTNSKMCPCVTLAEDVGLRRLQRGEAPSSAERPLHVFCFISAWRDWAVDSGPA